MTAPVEEDPRVQEILDKIAHPLTTKRELKLLERKLQLLRQHQK